MKRGRAYLHYSEELGKRNGLKRKRKKRIY